MMKKRGQMKLSFGMIFSIILIIIFMGFAFYGIKIFLNLKNEVQIKQFGEDFQNDVNKFWAGSQGSREVSYLLPNNIEGICFVNEELYNLKFESDKLIERQTIQHLDILNTLGSQESLCIPNIKGKVEFSIEKNFGEESVTVKK